MEIRIHYRHITHSENSSEDIKDWLMTFFDRVGHENLALDVYFSKTRVRLGSYKAQFECHMLARAPWLKKDLFAKATDDEFWTSLNEASHLLKRQVVKDRLQRKTTRHQPLQNISDAG